MKKLFLFMIAAFLLLGLSLNAASKENSIKDATGLAPYQLFKQAESQPAGFPNPGDDPDYQAYAYNAYDASGAVAEGPITYVLNNPAGLTALAATTSTDFLAGACWIADEETWYACQYGGGLYTIDITTGAMTNVATSISLGGIEYDDASGLMYGTDGTSLYTVDWTTGTTTLIGSHGLADTMIGIAGDGEGNLYGVTVSFTAIAPLYQIDLTTGVATSIGSTGGQLLYAQDLSFDKDAGTLYSAAYFGDGTPSGLYTIDTATAAMTLVGNFPGGMEVSGFAIPYTLAEPGAPAAPTNLAVIAGAAGALQCDISWTCPTLTFAGDPLTELLEMRVYRNGDLVYTDSAPVIGGNGSYPDYPTVAGMYDYTVLGYNTEGEGAPAGEEVWVGEDIPDAVTNLVLTDVSTTTLIAQLDWINPTAGFHGGYFAGCTDYEIERVNDGTIFNVTGSTTTWQDAVPAPGIYSYTITPFNGSGSGPSTTSAQVGIGISIVQVGNQEVTDYQMPMNIWYENSIVECVYDMEWIGTDMLINALAYHSNITSTVPPFNLEIWLGEVDVDDLSGGFINATQLTMVYDGTIDVTPGDHWIELSLDTPFEYTYAHNLVMGIVKDDGEYYTTSDVWWTTESGTANRSIHQYNDTTEYTIQSPPTSPNPKTTYPDVRFYYSVLAHGDVAGVITDNVTSNPIDGVEVFVGSFGPATTNALGEYLIEDIVTGLQPVTATRDGYYDFFGEVDVLADIVVTYDIGMDVNLFGALDGTVTDADSGDPLIGAEISAISLAGYEYNAITDDDGYYSIVDVVAETYDVTCAFPNYPTGMEQGVVVIDGAVTTVDFALEGYAYWCDFESNDGGLISSNASGWQWGAFTSGPMAGYSGTNGWGTVIGGLYAASSNYTLDTPAPFLITEPNAELRFWHWYDIETSWDGGNVKVSTDGGISWSVITSTTGYTGTGNTSNPLSGEPIFCGTTTYNYWHEEVFDLSSYQGQSIIIRWHFGSDSSGEYAGWYIDDVSLRGAEIPQQGSLEGTVTEFGTGNPIEDAVVTVGTGLNATTGADGTYYIPAIWPGIYDISCVAPLYLDAQELGFTIAEGANTLDFSLLWSEIAVDVVELNCYLPPDDIEVQTFTITNNGPGDLDYSIGLEYPEAISVRQMPITRKVQNTISKATVTTPIETRNVMSSDRDESPYLSRLSSELSREMWDLQFSFDATAVSGAAGNAGAEFDGTYFYTTRWASNLIHKYDINGALVEEFSIPGVTGLRDLAYDGTHFYGGASGNVIYEMDFDTHTLISSINSSVAARAIAYNEDLDAFFVSNFADPVGLIGHDGTTIATFNCGLAGTYGFAYDNLTDGGPYLWIFDQGAGGGSPQLIHQMDALTYTMTGVTHDVSLELPDPSGIAGGLFITTDFVSGIVTLGGLQQGVPDQVFCYELAPYSTWVAVTANSSGTVPGNGGTVLVEVTFDATDLLIGDIFTGNLAIANNSNYTRGDDYIIPVMLIVSGNIPPINLNVDEVTALFTWDTPPGSDITDSGNKEQTKKEMNSRSRDLLGYNVFLGEDQVGTTTANEWPYEDLIIGDYYVAGVSAVYDDGESEIQEFPFTYIGTDAGIIIPLQTELSGNFPNPFNPVTQIAFSLNERSHVQIMIYNIRGQLIRTLVDDQRDADSYVVIWNGTDDSNKSVSSGVYFYKMRSSNYTATKKMILMK